MDELQDQNIPLPQFEIQSVWKKDIGDGWLIGVGFIVFGIQFLFLNPFFWPLTCLAAFLLGLIALMRSVRKKEILLVFLSIALMVVPILYIFWLRSLNY